MRSTSLTQQSDRHRSTSSLPHRDKSQPPTNELCHTAQSAMEDQSPLTSPATSTANDDAVMGNDNNFHNKHAVNAITGRPKELIKMISDLSFSHLDNQIALPKIVVTGDQSAGKSSLIEAITGIKVPRDAGTCTRCPIHVSLSEPDDGAEWSCKVVIEKSYNFDPDMRSAQFNLEGLGPWTKNHNRVFVDFEQLHDPAHVESALRRAQAAVLHPSLHPRFFTAGADVTMLVGRQEEFSPNVVRLEISGPGLPNLSFFDLPGVISIHKSGKHLPDLVRTLVTRYIDEPTNIVLLAIPMGVDIETCQARALVNHANAEARTIGVLTKPDQMIPGDPIHAWEAILCGKDHALGHGYFVTKQPNQMQNKHGMTHIQARAAEADFFATQEPWNTIFSQYRNRCGTENLQNMLSSLLVEEIKNSIPRIRAQLEELINDLDGQLAVLPLPTKNPSMVVNQVISKLQQDVTQIMTGGFGRNHFINNWKTIVSDLLNNLREMRPTMVVATPSGHNLYGKRNASPSDSDIEIVSESPTPTSARKRGKAQSTVATPTKRVRVNKSGAKAFSLDQIRETLRSISTSGIPNTVDPRATDHIILEAVENWTIPVGNFLKHTENALKQEMDMLLEIILEPWQATALYKEAKTSVNLYVLGKMQLLRNKVNRMVDAELLKPMTFNVEALQHYKIEEWNFLCEKRRQKMAKEFLIAEEKIYDRDVREMSARLKKVTDEQIGPDLWAKETEVMAEVRAYYRVASLSLVDNIAKMLQIDLFEECRLTLATHLAESLKIYEEDGHLHCQRLLEDNPERAQRREQLLNNKKKHVEALQSLELAARAE